MPMNFSTNRIITAIAIVSIIASFVTSILLRRPLFLYGVEVIHDLQQPPSDALKIFFNIIQFLGEAYILGPIFVLVYMIIHRKLNGIVYLSFVATNIFLITLTKNSFQDGRPFWEFESINLLQWSCPTQYGNPSGHAWISILLFQPILTDFTGLGPFRWALFLIGVTGSMIPLCRLYLGVHSVDQILLGLSMSASILVVYRFGLQKFLFDLLYSCLIYQKSFKKYLIAGICHILCFISPIIIFIINTNIRMISDERLTEINEACSSDLTVYSIQKKHGLEGIIGSAIFGLIYGLFLASKFGGIDWWKKYYFGLWKYKNKKSIIIKILMYVICVGFPVGIFIVLIPHFVQNYYGAYISSSFGVVLACIAITFIVPYLARKNKLLIKKNDVQKQIRPQQRQKETDIQQITQIRRSPEYKINQSNIE